MVSQAKMSAAAKRMNPRYVKELRLLVLPAAVAAAAVLSYWLPFIQIGGSQPGTFVFPVCVALLAALSFGAEFQHRTLPLLLVQPIERPRLWWEKMAVLGGVVTFLGLLVWQAQGLANEFSHFHRALFNLFLFAGVCSAGFWAQKTGSTAVGFLLAMAIQLVLFTGTSLLLTSCLGPEPYPWDAQQTRLLVLAAITYSGFFLWLGWSYWKRRLWVLAGLGLAVLWFHWMTQSFSTHPEAVHVAPPDLALGALFLLTTVCSTAFWTLPARSTIGGAVFNAAGQFLGVLILSLVPPKIHSSLAIDGPYAAGVILVGGLAYSSLFLWLGWRTFARLELKGVTVGEGGDLSQQVGWRWPGMAWLKCGPRGGFVNLVRKELILQRPTFLIAAVLVGCCLIAFVVQVVTPAERGICQGLVSALAFISVPLILLLAGSVSLGEEKSLGISAWHLTLPVKAWRQWWVKVAVSVVTGLCLVFSCPV
jgi:ABC-type transport system involved in multi-copper enzyme maturation permease subunit